MAGNDLARRARRVVRSLRQASTAAAPGPSNPKRLVDSPVFILSSIRSGSTLMRVILNSHSKICAPHELHLGSVRVKLGANATAAMEAIDTSPRDLENLLWDRMLDLSLRESGKAIIVDKTPQNTFIWKRIRRMWPNARFLFLYRHPARIVESMHTAWSKADIETQYKTATDYAVALDEAHRATPEAKGLLVRYEDLTSDPVTQSQRVCTWLGVPWESGMTDYLAHEHGGFQARLGDWKDTIKTGVIRPAAPNPSPDEVPEQLREACRLLGYL